MTIQDSTRSPRKWLPTSLGLLLLIPALAAAAPRRGETSDRCLVNLNGASVLNTFVFKNVAPLAPGQVIPLQGLYFSSARRVAAFAGSAVMASDGSVRLGVFVHSSATPSSAGTFLNDFTLSGIIDASFDGELKVDTDGDFVPNGTLPVQSTDCSTIVIP